MAESGRGRGLVGGTRLTGLLGGEQAAEGILGRRTFGNLPIDADQPGDEGDDDQRKGDAELGEAAEHGNDEGDPGGGTDGSCENLAGALAARGGRGEDHQGPDEGVAGQSDDSAVAEGANADDDSEVVAEQRAHDGTDDADNGEQEKKRAKREAEGLRPGRWRRLARS